MSVDRIGERGRGSFENRGRAAARFSLESSAIAPQLSLSLSSLTSATGEDGSYSTPTAA